MRTDDAVADLVDDDRPVEVGDVAVDLDAAVHRPGVHDDGVVAEQAGPPAGEAVGGGVLAQAGQQRLGHALALHAQQVDGVDGGQHGVEVVADLHRIACRRPEAAAWAARPG